MRGNVLSELLPPNPLRTGSPCPQRYGNWGGRPQPLKGISLLISESCDASTKAEEETSISVNKNYPSSRAKSVSSPMAKLAFLSENSRNDTRAPNNLQETHNNLSGCPPTDSVSIKETLQEARKQSGELS